MFGQFFGTLAAACFLAGPTFATQEDPGDSIVYEPAFFADASPSTALDIVSRVPGFRIENGDDLRGFSGGMSR